jgi:signal transduction histidine kinase
VQRAQEQAERIGHLVDRLLDVSQLASGTLKLEFAPSDLGEIVEGVAQGLSEQAIASGSEIRLSVSKGITAETDKFRLEEAMSNIIANAIKYGAGRPIEIELKGVDAKAVILIEDRGIGIPQEDLGKIFGRFERSKISGNYGGLGLGLYIAHQIIEQHRGSIIAENRAGGGMRFLIELPRVVGSGRP